MPDTPTQMQIFLSHSSADKDMCDQLVAALRGAGADVWYDEHNLGAGVLRREIMKELSARPIVLVMLSKSAFASDWVQDECEWAYNLTRREPNRMILPVVVAAYEPRDFNSLLYLESMKRVEGPGNSPYPVAEMIARTLRLLALTPAGETTFAVLPQPSESLNDLLTQGRALSSQDKHAEALPFFQRATEANPTSFDASFNLGYTLSQLKRKAEALTAYERAIELDPNSSMAWNNKGNVLQDLKRYEEGLAAFEKSLALGPNYALTWKNKGNLLIDLKRSEKALAAYERALALDPNDAATWNDKAWALHLLGRATEALPAVERSLTLDPPDANALDTKGHALLGLKRFEEAIIWFDRALALDPRYRGSWEGKATTLRALGRTSEAEEAERRAKALGG
jgi:tetratricopeptide (TPR) repeat protein